MKFIDTNQRVIAAPKAPAAPVRADDAPAYTADCVGFWMPGCDDESDSFLWLYRDQEK